MAKVVSQENIAKFSKMFMTYGIHQYTITIPALIPVALILGA